jgi:ECF sigma factor
MSSPIDSATSTTPGITGLVHEAYFKLVDQNRVEWHDRAHVFGVASRAVRQILVEYARKRGALKPGGRVKRQWRRAKAWLCQELTA